jgi:hypothetical protein
MDLEHFRSLTQFPAQLPLALQALWHDRRGDWAQAHECAQDDHSPAGSWVHAYLHRKEGDLGNARYWYRQADQPVYPGSLEEEWEHIAETLLHDV